MGHKGGPEIIIADVVDRANVRGVSIWGVGVAELSCVRIRVCMDGDQHTTVWVASEERVHAPLHIPTLVIGARSHRHMQRIREELAPAQLPGYSRQYNGTYIVFLTSPLLLERLRNHASRGLISNPPPKYNA